MLDHTRCFTRYGCIVGARLVTYRQLERHYICNDCGGRILAKSRWTEETGSIYWAECAECGGRDFVSERFYDEQVTDHSHIINGLPRELRGLFSKPEREPITFDQAVEDLYG